MKTNKSRSHVTAVLFGQPACLGAEWGCSVIRFTRWSGQFWANCSLVYPTEIIITVHCCDYYYCIRYSISAVKSFTWHSVMIFVWYLYHGIPVWWSALPRNPDHRSARYSPDVPELHFSIWVLTVSSSCTHSKV
jgi:hypothetical protein